MTVGLISANTAAFGGTLPNAAAPNAEPPQIVKLACQKCLGVTNHQVLKEVEKKGWIEEADIGTWDSYQIVQCSGCERISFRHASSNSEDIDEETGEFAVTEKLFPYRLSGRKTIDGLAHLPLEVRRIYEETHTALAANALILGSVGIRAVVEAVCKDKKSKGGDLKEKIDDLVSQGWLAPRNAQFLHKSRWLGNVAAHELTPPDQPTLRSALNIIENLLQTIYILPATTP